MGCHSKRKTQVHPTGITLDWRIDKLLHFRKCNYLIKFPPNLKTLHPEDGTIKIDIFTPGQLWMETCADLQQRANAAMDLSTAHGRLRNTGKNFEQGTFPPPVTTNNPHDFSPRDIKRDISQSPDQVRSSRGMAC